MIQMHERDKHNGQEGGRESEAKENRVAMHVRTRARATASHRQSRASLHSHHLVATRLVVRVALCEGSLLAEWCVVVRLNDFQWYAC
eukprot:EC790992.1.p2 GENE.EC790992.1~~EC790992.1.p2  ORF type:complete len:87 (-),score=6.83 EC790992.1:15-275(-)